jgi:hypothetical protein
MKIEHQGYSAIKWVYKEAGAKTSVPYGIMGKATLVKFEPSNKGMMLITWDYKLPDI